MGSPNPSERARVGLSKGMSITLDDLAAEPEDSESAQTRAPTPPPVLADWPQATRKSTQLRGGKLGRRFGLRSTSTLCTNLVLPEA